MADEKGSPEKDQKHAGQEQHLGPGQPRPDNPRGTPQSGQSGFAQAHGEPSQQSPVQGGDSPAPAVQYGVIGNTAQYTISDAINKLQADDAGGEMPKSKQDLPEDAVTAAKAFDAVAIMGGTHAQFKGELKKAGTDPKAMQQIMAKRTPSPALQAARAQQTGAVHPIAGSTPAVHEAQHEAATAQQTARPATPPPGARR